jgi:uncharacterized membrane protein YcaP (DUF421 family)
MLKRPFNLPDLLYFDSMNFKLLKSGGFIDIDWHSFLLGSEEWNFLPEVAIRAAVMFLLILFSLRILGKRSVTQLSVFELGVIIGLGSAAGDPMFYKDVGLLPGMLVFIVVISLYRVVTYLINHSQQIEKALEGEPVYLVEDGKFNCKNFEEESIAHEEFFAQLRQNHITHLGQVELAIIETNGSISLYFYDDKEVKYGLPILPHLCTNKLTQLPANGIFACTYCGHIEEVKLALPELSCTECSKTEWIHAINKRRIS